MEFGKIEITDLNQTDFYLPSDPPVNKTILATSKHKTTEVHVGCARWSSKEWLGKFYPSGTGEKDFLSFYSRLFNCVELNTTYYSIPREEQVKKWKSQVNNEFKFCPKFPQSITHNRRLIHCDREVYEFLQSIGAFGNNLGPVFLMPHPQMGPKYLEIIKKFILKLPSDIELFLELRHPDWFRGGLNMDLYQFAIKYDIGLVITDAAGRRDCVHMHLSTPEAFIRFVGNGLHKTDYSRIDEWVKRIKQWFVEGLHKLYVFMHQPEELFAPQLNKYFIEKLNKECGFNIPVPALMNARIINQQGSLFE